MYRNHRKIENGVICISNDFIYSCPLKIDQNYKDPILGMFSNDYSMRFRNIFRAKSLKKILPRIEDEIAAGKLAADYGYMVGTFRGVNCDIFLPEFFNKYQFDTIIEEIDDHDFYDFSLYNEINGYRNDHFNISAIEAADFIASSYDDICYDAYHGFKGYDPERKEKAIRLMR